jgi:hypothetical protein
VPYVPFHSISYLETQYLLTTSVDIVLSDRFLYRVYDLKRKVYETNILEIKKELYNNYITSYTVTQCMRLHTRRPLLCLPQCQLYKATGSYRLFWFSTLLDISRHHLVQTSYYWCYQRFLPVTFEDLASCSWGAPD